MKRFNLRAYAIILNDRNEILLSDELRFGKAFTKFPGGGLEWGEGTADTVKREIKEEMGLDAEVGELFYVNPFFQQSAFGKDDQLMSFYYCIEAINYEEIPVTKHPVQLKEEGEKFRWISLSKLTVEMLTFPIDKIVVEKLKGLQQK